MTPLQTNKYLFSKITMECELIVLNTQQNKTPINYSNRNQL